MSSLFNWKSVCNQSSITHLTPNPPPPINSPWMDRSHDSSSLLDENCYSLESASRTVGGRGRYFSARCPFWVDSGLPWVYLVSCLAYSKNKTNCLKINCKANYIKIKIYKLKREESESYFYWACSSFLLAKSKFQFTSVGKFFICIFSMLEKTKY